MSHIPVTKGRQAGLTHAHDIVELLARAEDRLTRRAIDETDIALLKDLRATLQVVAPGRLLAHRTGGRHGTR